MSLENTFSAVWAFSSSGAAYTNNTLESTSAKGTAFTILAVAAVDYLYLGSTSRFDLAFFALNQVGSFGTLTWEYYNGSAWTAFAPSFDKLPQNEDGTAYDFTRDGAEIFDVGELSDWATFTITTSLPHAVGSVPDSVARYYIRISAASVSTAPTVYEIRRRPYSSYCLATDVANFLNLKFSFSTTSVPTLATVEEYAARAADHIDYATQRSWRPNVAIETHEFNIYGIKLANPSVWKVSKLEIWDGNSWEVKTEGRTNDWFFDASHNMLVFSRFFLLPARFQGFNYSPGWGGGEFRFPVRITYMYGHSIFLDRRWGQKIREISIKRVAIDLYNNHDYAKIIASGSDRISAGQKVQNWQLEIDEAIDRMRSWIVF